MYLSITQEVSRLHREEIMRTVIAARLGRTRAKGEEVYRPAGWGQNTTATGSGGTSEFLAPKKVVSR